MCIPRHLLCLILVTLFIRATFVPAEGVGLLEPIEVKGKEPISGKVGQNSSFPLVGVQPKDSQCIEECIRRNQMASVGFEIIQQQCRQECDFEVILTLIRSPRDEEYLKGVKALSRVNDPRAVQPLILALIRDLKERRGVWAWIIPALGALGDPTAVPVLTQTLTIDDDDWLGREMSARALGLIGDPSAIPYLLKATWRADTRDAAIQALVRFRDKRTIPVFLSALDPEEDKQTREAAINGLHLLGSIAVPEMLEAFTYFSSEHPETEKRLWLCQLLGASEDQRAIKILRNSMTDPDKLIRQCVAEVLQPQKQS